MRRWLESCKHIQETIHSDNRVTVEDNGRGIPVDMHATEKLSAVEVVMSDQGYLVRIRVADISRIGRNTQGVRFDHLGPGSASRGPNMHRGRERQHAGKRP